MQPVAKLVNLAKINNESGSHLIIRLKYFYLI